MARRYRDRLTKFKLPYITGHSTQPDALLKMCLLILKLRGEDAGCTERGCTWPPVIVEHDHVTGYIRDVACRRTNARRLT